MTDTFSDVLVTNLLTLQKELLIKTQNTELTVRNDGIQIFGLNGMQSGDDPLLYLANASLVTDNDIMVYGSISSFTDTAHNKKSGGGAIVIDHGWKGSAPDSDPAALSPPLIELWRTSSTVKSGANFPSVNDQAGQIFVRNGSMYIWSGNSTTGWIYADKNPSGYYDSLFLVKADGYTPADLNLGRAVIRDFLCLNPSQDQIRFKPYGYNNVIWTYKPSESKLFGIWDEGVSNWRFYIDTSGNLQCYCNIYPVSANNGNIGTNTNYWGAVWANYLCYHTNPGYYFDEYDDLAIVKQWGEKTPTVSKEYDSTKTKPPANDPFAILKSTDEHGEIAQEFFHVEKMQSFALGCAKALAKKQDQQQETISAMYEKMETLQEQISELKLKLQTQQPAA